MKQFSEYHFLKSRDSFQKIIRTLLQDVWTLNVRTHHDQRDLQKKIHCGLSQIKLLQFVTQLSEYAQISAIIYLERLIKNKNFMKFSFREQFLAVLGSFLIAIKYTEDYYFPLDFYTKFLSMNSNQIAESEQTLLNGLDFNLYIKHEEYHKYQQLIEKYLQKSKKKSNSHNQDNNDRSIISQKNIPENPFTESEERQGYSCILIE